MYGLVNRGLEQMVRTPLEIEPLGEDGATGEHSFWVQWECGSSNPA